ncbi:MAG TPA: gliding motility-associated ABC transporter ATP-binding subunit GldA [Bacteroidales bacterium]|jgi:ABC-2 type transport system ATP-binding protein|nr:gliding motility-associated ABC transporter ATP-binding subunit GldA [Bacteroidales bacterium]HOL99136.1 gliding motility-associated ABC transporter ATP-binding subunit GldA [Bacteroidales bacterium]HOM37512.1 gliding motility-associated ABC transporter ATP-binding subunit GldA [Bacteroidales bacterium]HPD25053.1 gliding motility-associated ABC transporter ATP-binding subunit GldA [Bacteroidales bacterium]HRT00716.1 gliding motility-associated ABC transporter ATP-binding subunit GldA [Bacter
MSIKINNVTKIYGKQKALDNVSFQVNSGEIVGFLGPNGAGKSTLMKIITSFIPPTEGDVYVNGLNVLEHQKEVKKLIGYLPEQNPLYNEMYIVEFLNFVAGLYNIKNRVERIDKIIQLTGLEPEIEKKIGALSKGFKQRVGLAQAIIHDPKILILDEPTSGLDPNQIIEIRNLIKELGKEKTVLLSTHIMQEVDAICDKIIIISNGKIIADDTTENIHKNFNKNSIELKVEFSEKISIEELKKIQGILEIEFLGLNTYLVRTDISKDLRKEIFDFAVKNNNPVLSIQVQETSLEKVFNELTRK